MSKNKRPEAYSAIQRDIGHRIKWARELVDTNRAAFARDMNSLEDTTTLTKIETGERPPSIFNVLELAHRLRVTTDYILRGLLRGVDGELAAELIENHPEVLDHNRRAMEADSDPSPRKQVG